MQRKIISLDWLAVGVLTAALLGWGALVALPALAADPTDIGTLDKESAERTYQAKRRTRLCWTQLPTRPFFGDTHLPHRSRWTPARSAAGSARRTPTASPRGEEVTASSGQRAKLSRPLDFLVVADHSDNMGFFPDLFAGKPQIWPIPRGASGTT